MQPKTIYPTNGKSQYPGTVPDRLQPHSIESEEALLGSILISADALIDCDETGLTSEDFFIHKHGWIFAAMKALGPKCDQVTLFDELCRRGQLEEIGGPSFLTNLTTLTPTHLNALYYARIVKRESIRRSLITAAGDISRLSFSSQDDDPTNIIQAASDILLKVSTGNQAGQAKPASFFCDQFLDSLDEYRKSENEVIGLPTGLADLDKLLGGLRAGKLILIGGRPGMGKSSLGLQVAKTAIHKRRSSVLYFSLEMVGEDLIERLVSAETGLDTDLMRGKKLSDSNYDAINRAAEYIAGWPLVIDDKTQNIEAMRARAVSHKFRHGLDLIVIDYGQRVTTGKNYQNRDAELGAVSAALKRLANDLQVPVVCIVSLSRKCEERHDKRPILSDLRESGNWEYDADIVLFIYRDEVYNPDTPVPSVAEIIVSKHRGGKMGMTSVYFKKHLTTFVDLEVRRQGLDY